MRTDFHLLEIDRLRSFLRERHIHIVMYEHYEAYRSRKIENSVQRRVSQTSALTRHFSGHELLVNREFSDA